MGACDVGSGDYGEAGAAVLCSSELLPRSPWCCYIFKFLKRIGNFLEIFKWEQKDVTVVFIYEGGSIYLRGIFNNNDNT